MESAHPVVYRLIPINPAAHLFEVHCTVERPDAAGQEFFMPAWIPGSYMIRDFAKNVISFRAESSNGPVNVKKTDKQTWKCTEAAGPLTAIYQVYAYDLSVRGAYLDTTRGFFNGTSVFVCPKGCESHPCQLLVEPPNGSEFSNWRVATAMQCAADTELYQFGHYQADNYDELIDHPVEMGTFDRVEFEVAEVAHEIVISGRHDADMDRLGRDLKQICQTHIRLFGELPPLTRYVFLVTVVGDGYGGLEHRASCSLLCSRYDLPQTGAEDVGEDYRKFLGLCSHEYFHTWNVKRIKPDLFVPYDLSRETHTQQLWAFEGITSYYDDLGLFRAGLIDLTSYLELLGQTATRVWRSPGRFKQSIAESSFDAWTKFYKQDENAANAITSYYTKGGLLALTLDMHIRQLTDDRNSLDTVMRRLWGEFGKRGIGLVEGEIERIASEVAGHDLSDFFQTYLYGTAELPVDNALSHIGIQFLQRRSVGSDDKGGAEKQQSELLQVSFGAQSENDPSGVRLTVVFENGAAQHAGLSAGDVIVAINENKIDKARFDKLLAGAQPGVEWVVHVFRRDELMRFTVILQEAMEDTIYLTIDEQATADQVRSRDLWCWNDPGSDK